jgi:hypothetical protein
MPDRIEFVPWIPLLPPYKKRGGGLLSALAGVIRGRARKMSQLDAAIADYNATRQDFTAARTKYLATLKGHDGHLEEDDVRDMDGLRMKTSLRAASNAFDLVQQAFYKLDPSAESRFGSGESRSTLETNLQTTALQLARANLRSSLPPRGLESGRGSMESQASMPVFASGVSTPRQAPAEVGRSQQEQPQQNHPQEAQRRQEPQRRQEQPQQPPQPPGRSQIQQREDAYLAHRRSDRPHFFGSYRAQPTPNSARRSRWQR